MNSSLISQIVLVLMSVVLIVMYVRPGFDVITSLQDDQQSLRNSIETANEFTRQLQQLQAKANSISMVDREALTTYLPDEADQLTTMWVLESIADEAQVEIASIAAAGEDTNDSGGESSPDTVNGATSTASTRMVPEGLVLTVGVSGTYDNFKEFLDLLEINEFPFLTQKLTVGSAVGEGGSSGGSDESGSAGDSTYTLVLLVPEYQSKKAINSNNTMADDMMMEEDIF